MKKFLALITAFSLCIGLLFFSNTKKTANTEVKADETKSEVNIFDSLGCAKVDKDWTSTDAVNDSTTIFSGLTLTNDIVINTTNNNYVLSFPMEFINTPGVDAAALLTLNVRKGLKLSSVEVMATEITIKNGKLTIALNDTLIAEKVSKIVGIQELTFGYFVVDSGVKIHVGGHSLSLIESGCKPYYECGKCGKYFTDAAGNNEIPSYLLSMFSDHSYVHINEVAATCEKTGVKEHYECSSCHKLFVRESETYKVVTEENLIIGKTEHNHQLFLSQVAATYNTIGTKAIYRCTMCNELFIKDGENFVLRTEDNMNIGKNITSMQVILGSVMNIRFTSPLNGSMIVYYKVNGIEKEITLYGKSDGKGNYTYDFDKLVPYEVLQTLRLNLRNVSNNANGEYDLSGELITSSIYDYLYDSCKTTSGDDQVAIVAFVKYAEAMRAYFKPEYVEINTSAFTRILEEKEIKYVEHDLLTEVTDIRKTGATSKEDSLFNGVYVMYNNGVQLCFALKGNYSVQVSVGSQSVVYGKDDDDNYVVTLLATSGKDDLSPADFNTVYKVVVNSGTTEDFYEISVNSYFYRLLKYGNPTDAEKALVIAAYNYGVYFGNAVRS